jgi:uncharacterized membrane protein
MAEETEITRIVPGDSQGIIVTWRRSLFGLGTALCFAISAIFIRAGLEELPSPLLGVTVGMVVTASAYGIILFFRRGQTRLGPVARDVLFFQLVAAVLVGLSTWARWIALDMAPVAVVLALGRLNVPVVIFLAPLLVGRIQERVTARVWLGAALIIIGSLILNFYS